jgi:hypothetical protein
MPDDLSQGRKSKGSAVLCSGSSYSSSVDERKSKGQYFSFPKNKKKKTVTKEELKTKVVSTCTEDEEED